MRAHAWQVLPSAHHCWHGEAKDFARCAVLANIQFHSVRVTPCAANPTVSVLVCNENSTTLAPIPPISPMPPRATCVTARDVLKRPRVAGAMVDALADDPPRGSGGSTFTTFFIIGLCAMAYVYRVRIAAELAAAWPMVEPYLAPIRPQLDAALFFARRQWEALEPLVRKLLAPFPSVSAQLGSYGLVRRTDDFHDPADAELAPMSDFESVVRQK